MKDFLEKIKEQARSDPKRIAFPESTEERTLNAIQKIIEERTAKPILIGTEDSIRKRISELGLNIGNLQIVDHLCDANKDYFERYSQELLEIRKEKGMTIEKARELMKQEIYY
ncbi:TPA: phosphate acetyltransferase, partial [Candidatus Woesearchaeota archaeon]|nr:phosphate acetyltransferase [Candidatus Woesearchaeota archaeon]